MTDWSQEVYDAHIADMKARERRADHPLYGQGRLIVRHHDHASNQDERNATRLATYNGIKHG